MHFSSIWEMSESEHLIFRLKFYNSKKKSIYSRGRDNLYIPCMKKKKSKGKALNYCQDLIFLQKIVCYFVFLCKTSGIPKTLKLCENEIFVQLKKFYNLN